MCIRDRSVGARGVDILSQFLIEAIIEEVKHAKGVKLDNELEVEDLKELVKDVYKRQGSASAKGVHQHSRRA